MTGTWAAGWATNDIVTAAEFKKSAGSIFDSTLGGAAANIDVTGILGTYAHLLITLYGRSDAAAGFASANVRFNGDSGTNYDVQSLQGQAAVTAASEGFGSNALVIGNLVANSAAANLFEAIQVFIPNYANSTNNKQVVSLSAGKIGVATTNMVVGMNGGSWRSNAAINQITFIPSSGNFMAGSRVTVHALGA